MDADFTLDATALERRLEEDRQHVTRRDTQPLIEAARRGDAVDPGDLAALWFSDRSTDDLYDLARTVRQPRSGPLETFAPLYMTNTCDAECRMCGMRRDNAALRRETADIDAVIEQLQLLSARGMRAVALLTGEYRAAHRPWAMRYVNQALRATQALHFNHVLINVGSIDAPEFAALLDGIARHADGSVVPKLSMSTFQETYAPRLYAKFMGTNPDNPRADFQRRLTNFDRAYRAGIRVANPGILVGLNANVVYELVALTLHARHLLALGMDIYLSVPRLRRIAGSDSQRGIDDGAFVRMVALLSLALPTCKIVITTRERSEIQHQLAPIVSVISAGSAAVAPYTVSGARFDLETSQFEVIDQRPFEEIMREHGARERAPIANFEPPHTAA